MSNPPPSTTNASLAPPTPATVVIAAPSAKKRPGRPKKSANTPVSAITSSPPEPTNVISNDESIVSVPEAPSAVTEPQDPVKRGRGRPKKVANSPSIMKFFSASSTTTSSVIPSPSGSDASAPIDIDDKSSVVLLTPPSLDVSHNKMEVVVEEAKNGEILVSAPPKRALAPPKPSPFPSSSMDVDETFEEDEVVIPTFVPRGRGRPKKNASSPASMTPSRPHTPSTGSKTKYPKEFKVSGGNEGGMDGVEATGESNAVSIAATRPARNVTARTSIGEDREPEASSSKLSYQAQKQYLNLISKRVWLPPIAPLRLARPLADAVGKDTYSIGQHFHIFPRPYEESCEKHAATVDYYPFPDWSCPLSSVKLLEAKNLVDFACGLPTPTKLEFSHAPENVPFEGFSVRRHEALRKNSQGSDFFLNVGGPVNELAWCPLPWPANKRIVVPSVLQRSFLAISSLKSHQQALKIEPHLGTPNMIQIWDVGAISNRGEHSAQDFTPFLSLAIVHHLTQVKHLVWCPIATPQPKTTSQFGASSSAIPDDNDNTSHSSMDTSGGGMGENAESFVPRLGLLAVVHGDGKLSILAIPHPLALHLHYHQDMYSKETIVMELEPVWTLETPDKSPLSKIAWSHLDNAQLIAAGTTDGKVAVWRLPLRLAGAQSQILCPVQVGTADEDNVDPAASETRDQSMNVGNASEKSGEKSSRMDTNALDQDALLLGLEDVPLPPLPLYQVDSSLLPIFYRGTHSNVTTGLQWHPILPHLFAVGTLSQYTSLWDIRRPQAPNQLIMLQGAICADLVFSGPELDYSYLVASDDGSMRLVTPPTSKLHEIHIAPCETIDYSQMLRLRVSGGFDGLVHFASLVDCRPTRSHFLQASRDPHGAWIDHVALKSEVEPNHPKNVTPCTDEPLLVQPLVFAYSATQSANYFSHPNGPPTVTTVESAEKPKKLTSSRNKAYPSQQVIHLQRPEYTNPLASITRVRWCPNPLTPSWLASATRAGIVRLQLLEWACPPSLADLPTPFAASKSK